MMELHPVIMEDLHSILSASISWDKLRHKTILVTGANGLIGSYLVYTCLYLNDMLDLDISLIGLVRNRHTACHRFGDFINRHDFRLLVQDVAAPIPKGLFVDYVLHGASQTSPKAFMDDPVGTIRANSLGTMNLLDFAVACKATFMLLSTREIYGAPPVGIPVVQESDYGIVDPTLVRSCYPESKRMAETLVAAYRHQFAVDASIVRLAHTYGPGMVIGDGRVVGDFISDYLHHRPIRMRSKGHTLLALTYVTDVICGIFLELLDFPDWIYNISRDDEPITVLALAQYICSLDPSQQMKIIYDLCQTDGAETGYVQHKVGIMDSQKAFRAGWKPAVTYQAGIKRLLGFYR